MLFNNAPAPSELHIPPGYGPMLKAALHGIGAPIGVMKERGNTHITFQTLEKRLFGTRLYSCMIDEGLHPVSKKPQLGLVFGFLIPLFGRSMLRRELIAWAGEAHCKPQGPLVVNVVFMIAEEQMASLERRPIPAAA